MIVLYIVQTFAYAYSGNPGGGIAPILPPMLNHGYMYAQFSGMPNIITLIDIGQQIFIFLVGFMQGFTVMKRMQKTDEKWRVLLHILFRAALVWGLAAVFWVGTVFIAEMYVPGTGWQYIVYKGTLGNIAWAGLAAGIIALLIKRGEHRFWIGFGLMIGTTIIWILVDPSSGIDPLFMAPFITDFLPTFGNIEIGVITSAVAAWIFNLDGTYNNDNWKKKVLPLTIGFMVLSYLSWFIQWADHHYVNMSLSTMAIGFSSLMIFTFYKMEQHDFKIPLLTPLGENMLLVFFLANLMNEFVYMGMILDPFGLVGINAWYGSVVNMILVGVIPTLLMWVLVWLLHRYNLFLKISLPSRKKKQV